MLRGLERRNHCNALRDNQRRASILLVKRAPGFGALVKRAPSTGTPGSPAITSLACTVVNATVRVTP